MKLQLFAFEDIHALLRDREPGKALRRLLTPDGALRPGFGNKNHAWYCAGRAHFDLGNYADARTAFRRALRADSADVKSLCSMGSCFEAEGKPKLAEMAYRSGLTMNPDGTTEAELNLNLANALFDQRRDLEALALYRKLTSRRDAVGERARSDILRVHERLRPKLSVVA